MRGIETLNTDRPFRYVVQCYLYTFSLSFLFVLLAAVPLSVAML
jgi:hypothetical protein